MSADLQGGSSGADRREEEVRPAGEAQDSAAALVQPREEGLHEAPPRGARTRHAHATHTPSSRVSVRSHDVMSPGRSGVQLHRRSSVPGEPEGTEGGAEETVVPAVRQEEAQVDQQGPGAPEGLRGTTQAGPKWTRPGQTRVD